MNNTMIVIAVFFGAAILVAIMVAIWALVRVRRTNDLRSKFGPEYGRVSRVEGDPRQAEKVLYERQKRVEKLDIRPLTERQRAEFADSWEHLQARFVDDPATAVTGADSLVQDVMNTRGYPVVDFEQRVADVSVDHPAVVQNYRIAHDLALRHERDGLPIEKLREAMIHYRALFADLLYDGGLDPVRNVIPEREQRLRRAG